MVILYFTYEMDKTLFVLLLSFSLFLYSDIDYTFNIPDLSYTTIIARYKYGLGLMLCNLHTLLVNL